MGLPQSKCAALEVMPICTFFAPTQIGIILTMARNKSASRHLPVVIEQDEDGVFIVSIPILRGCRSYGETIDEAMRNIAEAAALCLEDDLPSDKSVFIGVRDLEIVA
jgi:predicted RNase H-like HicB family nuclease